MSDKEFISLQNLSTFKEEADSSFASKVDLATKQDKGDYATNTALEEGLAGKQPLGDYATSAELTAGLAAKQDVVADLDTIRSGAALGATAVQPTDVSPIPELDVHRLFRTEYSITTLITNGTYSGDNSIWTEETAAVTLVANTDYSLPETIVVSGAAYTYDDTTGAISLSAATGDVSISAECDPVVPPTDMPSKGDIITLNGENQRYRVLKVTGNVAQLMQLGNYQSSVFSDGATKTFDNGSTGLKYEDSTLDTLMNTTYYNSLSSAIKNAIVPENRVQNMYSRAEGSSTSADFRMQRDNGNWYSYTRTDQTTVGQRNVYALDAADIAEYLGTDIVYTDLLNMFFEQTTIISRSVWTGSASASKSTNAWFVYGKNGYLSTSYYTYSYEAFPAFSINLSLIDWSAAQ